jgi:hypothetical protein
VYTLHDLRAFGRKQGWCPYFLARHVMAFANVIVYNYQYMIDPKVSQVGACKLPRLSRSARPGRRGPARAGARGPEGCGASCWQRARVWVAATAAAAAVVGL